ncbi:hypothetical protein EG68_09437 [Paragonimus skrjabini miyazakii]|uniref:TROVE domain-containing protein n=1 Tax=Paragonimus skrjabini miyazakii TaxID=59628 RepID=A0A8S9YF82_9TREM|nr:hypothetical protein EG68_09437 [Paragonimus skrjabini miyazakii]
MTLDEQSGLISCTVDVSKMNLENRLLTSSCSTAAKLTRNHLLLSDVGVNRILHLQSSVNFSLSMKRKSGRQVASPIFDSATPERELKTSRDLSLSDPATTRLSSWLNSVELNTQCSLEFCSDGDAFDPELSNVLGLDERAFDPKCLDVNPPDLTKTKLELLQVVASAMVDGGPLKNRESRIAFGRLLIDLCSHDPEFILKTAVYCRRELNIRTVANLLVAFACYNKACYSYVEKYFCCAVCLPSDWLEVAGYFKALSSTEHCKTVFPKILRKMLSAKFSEFDEYQLAKYNKEKSRTKRYRKAIKPRSVDVNTGGENLFVGLELMSLTIKYLVRLLHIHRPTFHVMCILGKPYPSDAFEFVKAGLDGDWDPKMAGQRMKLPTPLTWETELSKNKNTVESWRKLILTGKLPYMAMLRNLRNIIKSGVSDVVHRAVRNKLTNTRSVIASKQFPFRFFAAYSVLDELDRKLQYNHFLYRLFRKKDRVTSRKLKKKMSKVNERLLRPCKYTQSTLEDYRKALETAIELSIRNNLPPIRGKSLIICSVPITDTQHTKPARFGDDLRVISVLLGLMCARVCEAKTVYLAGSSSNHLIPLESYLSKRAACTSKPSENLLESVHWINYSVRPNVEEGLSVHEVVQNFYAVRQRMELVFMT